MTPRTSALSTRGLFNCQPNRWGGLRGLRMAGCAAALAGSAFVLSGCNDAQAGGLLGGSFGALAGQAISHNTTGTLIGLGIGAGAGYIIGNESDKARYDRHSHYSTSYYYDDRPVEVREYHYHHYHTYRGGCSNYDY